MPLYLPAPEPDPRGPDGLGWNRLSLAAHYSTPPAQCALRPRRYPALYDTRRDTRLAQWGPYNRCIRPRRWGQLTGPDCRSCPILTASPTTLDTDADRVLVHVTTRTIGQLWATESIDTPHLDHDPATGRHTHSTAWAWEELVRLHGWAIGRADHRVGFWLERRTGPRH
ncbi:hypothetical protein OG225_41935 (plasmid) [Nocardia sp. NBC_01377]|uniref:hypothetical protein n=1 Tax=Nocardia sp. NBC_01377 TaxID=2903595 RepID=UPI003251B105